MPPQTRNRGRGRLVSLGPVNTSGLPSLPFETLDEIVSHLTSVAVPYSVGERPFLCPTQLEYSESLRSLSETCRRLRRVFLVRAWQHLQVCASRRRSTRSRWPKELAEELVRQLEVVTIRNPTLASHVRIITVCLTEASAETVFAEFFRCLSLFQNLETVQIVHTPPRKPRHLIKKYKCPFREALRGCTFDSIRTLVLAPGALSMLKCCPNVATFKLLSNPRRPLDPQLRRLARYAPRLRTLICQPLALVHVKGCVLSRF
ncbi:hypothetical protein C8R47DRAFT_982492 [Mycena vitilis]|nr:hypothetical protein C8R47DRAFT_982492 [Mycena vitilis]